jgi:hypothetical protein
MKSGTVTVVPQQGRWACSVPHNLLARIPLAENSVDEVHSEHCLDPDSGALAHSEHLAAGLDEDEANHVVLPTLPLVERVFDNLAFKRTHVREYWCDGRLSDGRLRVRGRPAA